MFAVEWLQCSDVAMLLYCCWRAKEIGLSSVFGHNPSQSESSTLYFRHAHIELRLGQRDNGLGLRVRGWNAHQVFMVIFGTQVSDHLVKSFTSPRQNGSFRLYNVCHLQKTKTRVLILRFNRGCQYRQGIQGTSVTIGIPRQPFPAIKGPTHFGGTLRATHHHIQESFHPILRQVFLV